MAATAARADLSVPGHNWTLGGAYRRLMVRRRSAGVILSSATVVIATAILLSGCIASPERGDSRPLRMPVGIPEPIIADCEQSVGLGGSAPVTSIYRDTLGLHVRIGHSSRFAVGSGGGMSTTESALLSCLNVVARGRPVYPSDAAGRLLQWKYSTTVLWPCFAAHDANLGPTPSRATFLRGDPLEIDPYDLLRSPLSDVQTLQLGRDCPLIPRYLTIPSPSGIAVHPDGALLPVTCLECAPLPVGNPSPSR